MLSVLPLALPVLLSAPALPCAAIFVEEGGTASVDAQEVILEVGDGWIDQSWRVNGELPVAQLGWVIPAYGEVIEVADADLARFEGLREATAPQVWIESAGGYGDEGGGCACGGALKADAGGLERNAADTGFGEDVGVEIVAEGFTGTFEYTVLEATDTAALLTWLEDNGWSMGPSGPAIDAYVEEGGIQFVALQVDFDAAEVDRRELPGVRIRFAGESLRFPSLMAKYARPETMSTRVYVLADERARVAGDWSSVEFGSRDGGDVTGVDLDEALPAIYASMLYEIGGPMRTFAEIHSAPWSGRHLTRFDGVFDRAAHVSDAVFVADAGTGSTSSEIWLWDGGASDERRVQGALLFPLVLLGGLGVASLRRRS